MSTPYLAQLMLVSFNFAPKGFESCNGQLLPINQSQALFSLLGTTFGGDGRVNFGLPNLEGRTPVGVGDGIVLGQRGGEEFHTLIPSEVPAHTHQLRGMNVTANSANPAGNFFATTSAGASQYGTSTGAGNMNQATIPLMGGSQAHENRQPYLVLTWVIALSGIFPSQN